jgi:hypothetical protein
MIISKAIGNNSKTQDKHRASFNVLDGISNQIILKCTPLDLENNDRFVSIFKDNHKYLIIMYRKKNKNYISLNIFTLLKNEL